MKRLGFILLALGFLVGSLYSVIDEEAVRWGFVAPALGVALVGVLMARFGGRAAAEHEEVLHAGMQQIENAVTRLVDNVRTMNAEKETYDPYDVRQMIDDRLVDDVRTVVENRETISRVLGLQAFADFMSHFAAGERYLNRVWSASADGYIDEVRLHLGTALEQLQEARDFLRAKRA